MTVPQHVSRFLKLMLKDTSLFIEVALALLLAARGGLWLGEVVTESQLAIYWRLLSVAPLTTWGWALLLVGFANVAMLVFDTYSRISPAYRVLALLPLLFIYLFLAATIWEVGTPVAHQAALTAFFPAVITWYCLNKHIHQVFEGLRRHDA